MYVLWHGVTLIPWPPQEPTPLRFPVWLGIPKPMIPYPLLWEGAVRTVGSHLGRIPICSEVPDPPPPRGTTLPGAKSKTEGLPPPGTDGTLYTVKTEEEAGSQGTRGVVHVINGTPNIPLPELAATATYSFVCIDLEAGAILTCVHALILTSCDNSVPTAVTGRDAECTAYLRLFSRVSGGY